MSFIYWLNDTCTINRVTITEDSYNAENENESILYENIKCRLWKWRSKYIKNDNSKKNQFIITYKLYVELDYNLWIKWNYVLLWDEKYIIIHWQTARWWWDNHYIYEIEKYEQS